MHQAAAEHWNEIAAQGHLATKWAKKMFPLKAQKMDAALEAEETKIADEIKDPIVAAAYLKVMPLLWERKAIKTYLADNPNLQNAMPPQETVSEALILASKDFRLTDSQLSKLRTLLERPPT